MTETGQPRARGPADDAGQKPSWRRAGAPAQPPEEPALDDRTLVHQARPAEPAQSARAAQGSAEPDTEHATRLLAEEAREDLPQIPGLTLQHELGRGGMGIVYLGKQGYLDRRVAVKLLAQGSQSEEFTRRFQREAKILASLSHPHVVACYEAGVAPDGRCYLAMEYIDGPTLGDWIQAHGPLPGERAVELCRSLASALAHAYRAGIIHRDVKPANVLLKSAAGREASDAFPFEPMLVDLGLARPSQDAPTFADATLKGLTIQGAVMGSPPTMAPEQFDAPDKVDFRTDIYGLGCVLFHCLTGKLAFPQGTLTQLIARKAEGKPPDPRELRRDMSSELAELVCAMLAPKPEHRPTSYEELQRRLAGPFLPEKPKARPRLLAYGAAALVVLAGAWLGFGALLGGNDGEQGEREERPLDEERPRVADDERGAGASGRAPAGRNEPEPDPLTATVVARDPEPARTDPGSEGARGTQAPPVVGAGGEQAGDELEPHPDPRDPEPALQEEPPAIVLPELEPIAPGEVRELLLDHAQDWRTTAGEFVFSRSDDRESGIDWLSEGRVAAHCALPAPPWTLSGKAKMLRPERVVTRRLAVVIVLQGERGLLLEQTMSADEVQLTCSLAQRQAEGWIASAELEPLAFGSLSRAAYNEASPVSFEIAWDGALLEIAWSLAGSEEDARRTALTRDELREHGYPVALGLELESGAAALSEFLLRGR